jgi:hypothetical protein
LAIAAVTATICKLLDSLDGDPFGPVKVTALPPDQIKPEDPSPRALNVFLYQVTPNLGWRSAGLPSHSSLDQGVRLSNPPLALDLHYLLTAYGGQDLEAEIALGCGMEVLHDARVLSRTQIRHTLALDNGGQGSGQAKKLAEIKADQEGRKAIDLADQIEQIKITPQFLSSDELSKLWTAMQARYRPSMAYLATTVIIQGRKPIYSTLPVLARGKDDQGYDAQADVRSPAPTVPMLLNLRVIAAKPGEALAAAELGDTIELHGALFGDDRDRVVALLRGPSPNGVPRNKLLKPTDVKPDVVRIVLPHGANAELKWPAGTYTIALKITPPNEPAAYTSELAFTLAPRLSEKPKVSRQGDDLILEAKFRPQIHVGQQVELLVGSQSFAASLDPTKTPPPDPSSTAKVSIKGIQATSAPMPVRLRVDGVESQLVRDRTAQPPKFDAEQCIVLPP